VKILQSANTMFFPIFAIYVSISTSSSNLITFKNSVDKEIEMVRCGVILSIAMVVMTSTMVANAPP